jgi:hypothetical protein
VSNGNPYVIAGGSNEVMHVLHPRLRYPDLWSGCIGAWCPALGPTGLRLADNSGLGKHGTLRNMEPDDWIIQKGYSGLRFGGTNEDVLTGGFPTQYNPISQAYYSAWIRRNATSDTISFGSYAGIPSTAFSVTVFSDTRVYFDVGSGFDNFVSSGTEMMHIICGYDGTQAAGSRTYFYQNGMLAARSTGGTTPATISPASGIAIGSRGGTDRYGVGDIFEVRLNLGICTSATAYLLSRRPGIAYETAHRRSYKAAAAPAATANNLMLLGVG